MARITYDPSTGPPLPTEDIPWDAALFDGRYYVSFALLRQPCSWPRTKYLRLLFPDTQGVFCWRSRPDAALKNLDAPVHPFSDLSFRKHFVLCLAMPAPQLVGWALSRPKFYEVDAAGRILLLMSVSTAMAAVYGVKDARIAACFGRPIPRLVRWMTVTDSPQPMKWPVQSLNPTDDRIRPTLFFAVLATTSRSDVIRPMRPSCCRLA